MDKKRIGEIKELLNSVPKGPWHFNEGSDFDHWELWSSHEKDGCHMVQDDSGVPPDPDFINYVLKSRGIIEELLKEID